VALTGRGVAGIVSCGVVDPYSMSIRAERHIQRSPPRFFFLLTSWTVSRP
jgi:hypothetical protein